MISCIRILLLVCLLTPAGLANASPSDKGAASALRGVSSVFVDTGTDAALHDAVVTNLKSELPKLTIVDRAEDAALVLRFSSDSDPGSVPVGQRDARIVVAQDMEHATDTDRQTKTAPSGGGIVEPSDGGTRAVDSMAPPVPPPSVYRTVFCSVLVRQSAPAMSEVLTIKRRAGAASDGPARAIVRKFAKVYRKANVTS